MPDAKEAGELAAVFLFLTVASGGVLAVVLLVTAGVR